MESPLKEITEQTAIILSSHVRIVRRFYLKERLNKQNVLSFIARIAVIKILSSSLSKNILVQHLRTRSEFNINISFFVAEFFKLSPTKKPA